MNPQAGEIFFNLFVSYREKVRARIGDERAEKYQASEALLALAEYRMESEKDHLEQGLVRTFGYDALYGKKPVTRLAMGLAAPVLWIAARARYAFRKKAETRLLFSNTFIRSPRYAEMRKQVEAETGCTPLMTFLDMIRIDVPGTGKMIRESLRLDGGRLKPAFLPCFSAAGGKLQKTFAEYYRTIFRMTFGEDDGEAVPDGLLDRLQEAYLERVEWLKRRLGKVKTELYLTINQYNLRDLLVIHACRDLGVPTVQQEHHALEFIQYQFDPEHPMYRFSLVDHYGFWSRTERLFHEKVYRYDSLLYPPEKVRFLVTGDTEISLEQAQACLRQYPEQRKLTFVTPGVDVETFRTEEEATAYRAWRWKVFSGLREFSRKQGVTVCVRYRPMKEQEYREEEIPVLKEWGFEISRSVAENLMEDLCSSMAVMSSATSALATARLLGKEIYRVEDWEVEYIHVDDSVHEVRLAELKDLQLPERGENAGTVDPEGFFAIGRLVRLLREEKQ